MIKINGVSGVSGRIIINGRDILDDESIKSRKYDQIKKEEAGEVETIWIDSSTVDTKVLATDTDTISAHLFGQAKSDQEVVLVVQKENEKYIFIRVEYGGNFFSGNLKLTVSIPRKLFKKISFESVSSDISFEEGVLADTITVKTTSGDIESNAAFSSFSGESVSGDVDIYAKPNGNVEVSVSTVSGDVYADYSKFGRVSLATTTISGDTRNIHKNATGFSVDGRIKTVSGDIMIK